MSQTSSILPRSELPSISRTASMRCAQIEHHGVERLAAREREQLPGQALAAARGRLDRVDRAQVLGLGDPPAQHLRVAAHDHQQIVEVVRDAAGQLAERLHLLRLRQLFARARRARLRLAPLGDVAGDLGKADQRAFLVMDRVDDDTRPEAAAVLAHGASLRPRIFLRARRSAERLVGQAGFALLGVE